MAVDHRGDAGVRCADHRDSLLDGAQPRRGEMLVGSGAVSEPGIVGDRQQQARARPGGDDPTGKDDLVADQRAEARQAGDLEGGRARAGAEVETALGQLREPEDTAQRNVLAEWHEMELVVGGQDPAVARHGMERVPDLGRAVGTVAVPRRPGQEQRPGGKPAAEVLSELGAAAQVERHCGLRPDHVGDGGRSRLPGQGQQRLQVLTPQPGVPFELLGDRRLHDAKRHSGNRLGGGRRGPGQTQLAAAPQQAEQRERRQRTAPSLQRTRRVLAAGQGGQPGHHQGHRGKPPDAEHGGGLYHGRGERPDRADQVPWKAGESPGAQPFGQQPGRCQHQDPAPAAGAGKPDQEQGKAGEQRKAAGQSSDRRHDQDGMGFGIDQEGDADPVEPGGEVSEAEGPAQQKGGPATIGAVQEPEQADEGGHEGGDQMQRRQRRHRQGAEQGRQHQAPPGTLPGAPEGQTARPGRGGPTRGEPTLGGRLKAHRCRRGPEAGC